MPSRRWCVQQIRSTPGGVAILTLPHGSYECISTEHICRVPFAMPDDAGKARVSDRTRESRMSTDRSSDRPGPRIPIPRRVSKSPEGSSTSTFGPDPRIPDLETPHHRQHRTDCRDEERDHEHRADDLGLLADAVYARRRVLQFGRGDDAGQSAADTGCGRE